MKRVKVLRPFDAHAAGDTPTLFGAVARDRRERGDVEWLDDVSEAAPAAPPAEVVADEPVAAPAKSKPARRAKK